MTIFVDTLRGLVNSLTGLGGLSDKGAAGSWNFAPMSREQVEAAYRSNWMIRKAVDIPVFDMMREGWQWQGDRDVIGALEKEQERLGVAAKVYEAMVLGRLHGGGAIIMSDGNEASLPLAVGRNKLKFLTVISRHELSSQEIENDPMAHGFGEPVMYRLTSASGGAVDIHPSRVVRFYGARLPRSTGTLMADEWSDSIVETINASVRDATATQQGIANLVQEASVDIWRIEGLMNQVSNADYRKALNDRMMLVQQMKGMVNATVMDKGDEWSQKTANFSQLPEVINRQLQIVSGAVDIPATRFLGQSPAGLNSTGDSDIRNYYDRLGAEQKLFLRPALQKIMDALVPSVLGAFPEDLWFDFPSLWQISEKERAEIGKLNSESADIVMRNNLVPGEVMAEATLNQMIESGNWPGLEAAYEQWQEVNPDSEFDLGQGSEEEETPDDENVLADAKPRTLYVRRKLLNADEVIAWAKSQGFTSTLPAEDMHVTLIYSRAPVDWMKMGQPWEDALEVPEGGPRLIEEFDSGAVVLLFGSSELQWRHERMKEEGASFDYPEYQPHITLAYEGAPEDIDSIEPYRGVLKFGPEIFEEVDEDWKQGIKEKA